jgi:cyanophycin synthetase
VLNATDPLVVAMAPRCRGSVIYFAFDPDLELIGAHRARGGHAVFVRHGEIVLAEGSRETGLSRLTDIPLTHGGRIPFQVENALAVAAAAWALGVDLDAIRQALETFGAETETVPGRFNLFEIHNATVIVDYGHNTSALEALFEAVLPLPCRRRSIVYSAAGDRRDEDMVAQGAMLAKHFDAVYLYEDQYRRGRAEGEIIALFRKGLDQSGRSPQVCEYQASSFLAVEDALRQLMPGDLLVVQADTIDGTVGFIRRYIEASAVGRELSTLEEVEGLAYARARKLEAVEVD